MPSMTMTPAQFYALIGDRFGATAGRARAHRGHDIPWGAGTIIPAYRGGVVVGNQWSGELGWVLIVRYDDAPAQYRFAGFCHQLRQSALGYGHWFSRGDDLGVVGNTGTASQGAHCHTTIGPNLDSVFQGTVYDPLPFIQSSLAAVAGGGSTPIINTPKGNLDMYLLRTLDGTVNLVTTSGIEPIISPAHLQLIQRMFNSYPNFDTFNDAERDIIMSYIYRANEIDAAQTNQLAAAIKAIPSLDVAAVARAAAEAAKAGAIEALKGADIDATVSDSIIAKIALQAATITEQRLQDEFAAVPGATVKAVASALS